MENNLSYNALMNRTNAMADGVEKVKMREKCIEIADLENNEYQQIDSRINYVRDISYAEVCTDKYFAVYPWLLNKIKDKKFSSYSSDVLWYYKWIIDMMINFPNISLQQIEKAFEDFKEQFIKYGSDAKTYHAYKCCYFNNIGKTEEAKKEYEEWKKIKRNSFLNDCPACVTNRVVGIELDLDDYKTALKKAKPLLTGKQKCRHVPQLTYSKILLPAFLEKDYELAEELAEKLWIIIKNGSDSNNCIHATKLIFYYTKTQNLRRVKILIEKLMHKAYIHKNLDSKYRFYLSVLYFLKNEKKDEITLKLNPAIDFYNKENIYSVNELLEYFDKATDSLAVKFDNRNKNSFISSLKAKYLSL